MKKNPLSLTGISLLMLATASCADGPSNEAEANVLESLQGDGVELVETFEGPEGLTGHIGQYRGQTLEFYVTADKQNAIMGPMIDAQGEAVHAQRRAAAGGNESGAKLDWDSLADTHWVVDGDPNADRIVYAFTDPNCPYCAMFWQQSQAYLKRGGVQVRHIMVGLLRPSSLPLAATILAADNPTEALAEHERNMESDGIEAMTDIPEKYSTQVRRNTEFMRSNNIRATPAIVFKDKKGQVQQIQGVPSKKLMDEHIFQTQ